MKCYVKANDMCFLGEEVRDAAFQLTSHVAFAALMIGSQVQEGKGCYRRGWVKSP